MKKIVVVTTPGGGYWLRGTIWSFALDRADRFNDEASARKALERARPFMRATDYRSARVVDDPDEAKQA